MMDIKYGKIFSLLLVCKTGHLFLGILYENYISESQNFYMSFHVNHYTSHIPHSTFL